MELILYYDGKCPFCNRYADILKLKKCYHIKICDARTNLHWKKLDENIQLDEGVILQYDDTYFQGVEALNMLLYICKYDGVFFLLQKWIFSNKFVGNIVYSGFKYLRKIALISKGV